VNALRNSILAALLTACLLTLAAPDAHAQMGAASRGPATQANGASAAWTPQPSVSISSVNASAPAPILINRRVVVLDPAHGGSDSGAQISDTTVEKDVTLALAFRLRAMLTARGFTVVMTRDSDAMASPTPGAGELTLDDRAGVANHAHAAACLLLHASGSGVGVHLYRSELDAAPGESAVPPWLTAQAAWIPQSSLLEGELANALTRSGIPLVTGRASVRPMDSLTCPALVVELAPADEDVDSMNRTDYQQQVARAIAGALLVWADQVQAPLRLSSAAPAMNHPGAGSSGAGVQP